MGRLLKNEDKGSQGGEKEWLWTCTSCEESIINSTFVFRFKVAANLILLVSFFV